MKSQTSPKRPYKFKDSIFDRLRDRIVFTDSCWLWNGCVNNRGYSMCSYKTKAYLVHRLLYELMVGPIPVGKQLDHLCRVHNCINPLHLQVVSNRENALRGHKQTVACTKGHAYTPDNTYWYTDGRRRCRECHRLEAQIRRDAVKEIGELP